MLLAYPKESWEITREQVNNYEDPGGIGSLTWRRSNTALVSYTIYYSIQTLSRLYDSVVILPGVTGDLILVKNERKIVK